MSFSLEQLLGNYLNPSQTRLTNSLMILGNVYMTKLHFFLLIFRHFLKTKKVTKTDIAEKFYFSLSDNIIPIKLDATS